MALSNPEEIQSRYDYNMYVFKYDSLFSSIPMEMIVETSYYQTVYPVVSPLAFIYFLSTYLLTETLPLVPSIVVYVK